MQICRHEGFRLTGSGKSYDTAQMYILRLMQDPGRNLLCVRKADVTNRDSTFAELQAAIFRMFGDSAERYWYINSSAMKLRCRSNGNEVIFRGVNDDRQREKLKSITFSRGKLTDVWIEEATELTQADFEIIDDRLRGELPDGLFYQIRMTFNPISATHWIKKTFFDRKDPNVLTHTSTYLENRFIDDGFRERMKRRKEVDPEGYQVYALGNWGTTEGLILHNYIIEEVNQDLNWYDDAAIGQDFGFNHNNAIYVLGMKDGDLYVIRGLYGTGMDTAEWIEKADRLDIPKNVTMWADSAEPDRIKTWRKAGYSCRGVQKEQGSIQAQIDWLKGRPAVHDGEAIKRTIHIDHRCTGFIKEIEQWRWKKDERTGEYLDEPVPFQDDAMAALRYGIEGWRKPQARLNTRITGGI